MATIAVRQAQTRQRLFVGREREIGQFRAMLKADEAPRIFLIHGPGGIGKSTLLQAYSRIARDAEAGFSQLDARNLRPVPMLLARAVESTLSRCANRALCVLAIDHYERLAALDGWLSEELIPGLPANTLLVLAGRERPAPGWFADPGISELLVEQSLASLTDGQSAEYLQRREIKNDLRGKILEFARGYPLALALASDVAQRAVGRMFDPARPDLVKALVESLLEDIDDPLHLCALRACATMRIVNTSLLSAMLDGSAEAAFDWLSDRHFIEAQSEGLVIHDLVRDVVIRELRGRDLEQHHALIQRATDYLLSNLEQASQQEVHRAIGDTIHALRYEPHMQRHFPFDDHSYYPDAVQPGEIPALADEVDHLEGVEARGWFEYWMQRQPQGLIVMRDSARNPVGLIFSLTFGSMEMAAGSDDPVVDTFIKHLRRHAPLREREQGLLMRFMFAHSTHQERTPVWAHVAVTSNTLMFTPGITLVAFVADLSNDWGGLADNAGANFLVDTEYSVENRRFSLIGHDARSEPPIAWARNCTARILHRGPNAQTRPPEVIVLSKDSFSAAVTAALKNFEKKHKLQQNPLLLSGMLRRRTGGCCPDVEDLRELIRKACEEILETKPTSLCHRVLETAYFHRESKKLAAAEKLHLSERTYRRRLREAEQAIVETLWHYETCGV